MAMAKKRQAIGILYESDEWSDHKLASELQQALADEGCSAEVALIDMCQPNAADAALSCDMLISRVFASARFRGHLSALLNMEALVPRTEAAGIPMLNHGSAHSFEVDKRLSTAVLAQAGLSVPEVYICAETSDIKADTLPFPCIIKPNCGGRTTCTAILSDAAQAQAFLEEAADTAGIAGIVDTAGTAGIAGGTDHAATQGSSPSASTYSAFIVEEYIAPEHGYLTRIEIVDGQVALVVKRSVAESGLSGYHEGSAYMPYANPPPELISDAHKAAEALGFAFGSFDVIEAQGKRFFIDANSVSNVSEDCSELLGLDLMAMHARAMARRFATLQFSRHGEIEESERERERERERESESERRGLSCYQ